MIIWTFNDGGRKAAGYKGDAGDCGARALAIVAEIPYEEAYALVNTYALKERPGARKRKRRSNARTGVWQTTLKKVLLDLGFTWVPTMGIGTGCRVHLKASELPAGRLLVNVSRHYTTMIDGVIHDTFDPSRGGTRCVYGYFTR